VDNDWSLVSSKSSQHMSSKSVEPVSPSFQLILDKRPVLNIDSSTLNCENVLSSSNEPMSVDSNLSNKLRPITDIDNKSTGNKSILSNIIIIFQHATLLSTLCPKLRWVPHFNYLNSLVTKWSNLFRALAGTWWGAHSSSLLLIFKSIIGSKVDYGSFLLVSASRTLQKLNSLLTSCLRTVIGVVFSMPNVCMEIELLCPPIEIRSQRLAIKFMLKYITNRQNSIFKSFLILSTRWR